jgi:hypothetical protein
LYGETLLSPGCAGTINVDTSSPTPAKQAMRTNDHAVGT